MVMRRALMPNRFSSFARPTWPSASGIPLRQHHQRAAAVSGRRKPERVHGIVLGVRAGDRAGEGQPAILQTVIGRRLVGEEAVGMRRGLRSAKRPTQSAALPLTSAGQKGSRCRAASRCPIRTGGQRGWYRGWPASAPSGPSSEHRVRHWAEEFSVADLKEQTPRRRMASRDLRAARPHKEIVNPHKKEPRPGR